MFETTPPTEQQLAAYEALASAATPGPWGAYTFGGDTLIEIAADLNDTGCGYQARRTIARFEDEPLDNDPQHREWTAEEDWAQVQADAAYIAGMPPEVTLALVAEVRRLRAENAAGLANGIRYAAWLVDGAFHGEPFLAYPPDFAALLREHADRLDAARTSGAPVPPVPAPEAPKPHTGAERPSETDTLPAWLARRFDPNGPDWDQLDDEDRAYWEHQARAVRRAVARGGFKAAAGSAVAATGDEQ